MYKVGMNPADRARLAQLRRHYRNWLKRELAGEQMAWTPSQSEPVFFLRIIDELLGKK
jgi:hypothetical protein